jgi:DNA-binding response OmpR family regulator
MFTHRVLVVSADEFLSDSIAHALIHEERVVDRVTSWRSAERMLPHVRPHLVVLDADSAGVDDRPVVDRVRTATDVPLVVLSLSSHLGDKLAALRAGADEVLDKPVDLSELVCRVSVLLRRNGRRSVTIELGDLAVDEGTRTVERRGRHVELTTIEFALLLALSRNRGLVLSKRQLMTMVWGVDHHNLNLVEVHVSALRRKLEVAGPRIIHTVRGAGYALRPVADGDDGEAVERSRSSTDRTHDRPRAGRTGAAFAS